MSGVGPGVAPLAVLACVCGLLAAGCGAKTGLSVPDASVDAGLDAGVPCIEIPLDGGVVDLPLETEAEVGRADVVFLIDITASMDQEIDRIQEQLRDRLAPAISAEIPDAQFAVATFADFPVDPYGDRGDAPFTLMHPMTDDLARIQGVLDAIETGNGRDEAESHVEALYQIATGEGLGGYIPPSFGCPGGGFGYPCFRVAALPILLLFTDAPMHNGPGGRNPYTRSVSPTPHSYPDARAALQALGIRVIGFDSGAGEARQDLTAIARDTETLDREGNPLVYDIGRQGERLGTGVVEAVKTFAGAVVFDIDTVLVDPDPADGVDVTAFVEAVVPISAVPMSGIEGIDVDRGVFVGVRAGTRVLFRLTVRNDAVVPGTEPQRFLLEIVFRGDGRTELGRRTVELVIPGADGEGCDALVGPE